MSEVIQTPLEGEPNPTGNVTPEGSGGDPSQVPVTPEGFVPLADLERERQRTRDFQAEKDRLAARLAKFEAEKQGGGDPKTPMGFDPEDFRRTVIRDAVQATSLAREAEALRAAYPHADESLLAPDSIAGFGSIEALRLAVGESHRRVAAILDAEKAKMEEALKAEFAARYGGVPNSPQGGTLLPPGDPTPEQLSRMTDAQWDELEKRNPGVIDRVLRNAG